MKSNYNFELIENPIILREMNIGKTPAMMINGEIVLEGRIPSGPEVLYILKRSLEEKESHIKKE